MNIRKHVKSVHALVQNAPLLRQYSHGAIFTAGDMAPLTWGSGMGQFPKPAADTQPSGRVQRSLQKS